MWLLLGGLACHGDPHDPVDVATDTEGAGSSGDTGASPVVPLEITVGYERSSGLVRLVGFVTVQTSAPTTATVEVDDGGRSWVHTDDARTTDHRVRILGMRPDAVHTFAVTATADDGQTVTAAPVSFTTDALPGDFPAYTVVSDPARMEPGLTLTEIGPYLAMLDPEGVVRWWMAYGGLPSEVTITPRHTLLLVNGRTHIEEYELDGAHVASWRAARTTDEPAAAVAVDVEALHHDVHELPDGNLLALSIERRFLHDYPSSETNPSAPPQDAWVAGDIVVELQRDGTVVNAWPLLDLLDPRRIALNGLRGDHWEAFYGGDDIKDWSHANAVWYDAARDEVVVSLRHQDAVVAIDHATGALTWIFAPDSGWQPPWDDLLLRPAVPTLGVYHQHGAKITPSGTLMLFDNGNARASAFEPPTPDDENASRGAEVRLDHAARTWSLEWSVTTSPPLFSGSLGDCDPLPATGNVLVTFGNVKDVDHDAVQVLEATRDSPPEVVFELHVPQPYTTFRSQRVTGVVPGF